MANPKSSIGDKVYSQEKKTKPINANTKEKVPRSKPFDVVWDGRLLNKMKYGLSGTFESIIL